MCSVHPSNIKKVFVSELQQALEIRYVQRGQNHGGFQGKIYERKRLIKSRIPDQDLSVP